LRCLTGQPFVCGSTSLRPLALRPQLKREPLGSHYSSAGLSMPFLSVPFIMMAAGAINVAWAVARFPRAFSSARWPTTEGLIMARDLDDSPGKYQPLFEYRYQVDGVPFRGSRISFGPPFNPQAFQRALVTYHQYPPGKAVTVYYDPQHPDRSVLEPGINEWLGAQLVGGLVLIALAQFVPG